MCYNVPTNDEIYSVNLITNQFERLRSCPIDMDIACFPLCFSFFVKTAIKGQGQFYAFLSLSERSWRTICTSSSLGRSEPNTRRQSCWARRTPDMMQGREVSWGQWNLSEMHHVSLIKKGTNGMWTWTDITKGFEDPRAWGCQLPLSQIEPYKHDITWLNWVDHSWTSLLPWFVRNLPEQFFVYPSWEDELLVIDKPPMFTCNYGSGKLPPTVPWWHRMAQQGNTCWRSWCIVGCWL